jgi:hypothetical protein
MPVLMIAKAATASGAIDETDEMIAEIDEEVERPMIPRLGGGEEDRRTVMDLEARRGEEEGTTVGHRLEGIERGIREGEDTAGGREGQIVCTTPP